MSNCATTRWPAALMLLGSLSLSDSAVASDWYRLLAAHPSVAELEARAGQWQRMADGADALPKPVIGFGLNNLPVDSPDRFDRYLPTSRSLEWSQRIPASVVRSAEERQLEARAGIARLEAESKLAELERQAWSVSARLGRVAASLPVVDGQLALIDELERWLRGVMQGGRAVYARFDELDVRRAVLEEERIALEGERLEREAELESLFGGPAPEPPVFGLPPQWGGEDDSFVAVRLATARVELARAAEEERRADFAPEFTLSAAYQQRESGKGFDGGDWFTIKAAVSLPLWAEWSQRPRLEAAAHGVAAALAAVEEAKRTARQALQRHLAEEQTVDRLLAALAVREERLLHLEEAARRAYEAGEMELEGVIKPAMQRVGIGSERARLQQRLTMAIAARRALFGRVEVEP